MTDWPGRRVSTGPALAVRATSPASPYARDRVQAPSNRPAPRTPTLRSRTQDVIRSAPGALTAARERQVYDTTWDDVGSGAQELTGLPSLARGAGALAALPALARTGSLGTEHLAPGAMAVGETALGLLGPMSLPRNAPRIAAPQIAEETAQRIPRVAREIGPNGMPIAQPQPIRNSLRGGSDDLREAAGMGAVQRLDDPQGRGFITYREGPDGWQVRQSRVLGEHRGQGVGTQLYSDLIERARAAGAPRITSDVTVSEDAARVYDSLQRRGYPVQRSERFEPGALHSRPPFSIDLTQPRTPPPTTPTGTAPFGDPRAYPPQAWEEFGSLQGGAPEARARVPDGGSAGGERVAYRGLNRPYDPANGGYYQAFTSSEADAREYGSHVIAANLRLGRNLAVDGGGNNFNALSVSQLPSDVRARLHPGAGSAVTTDQIAHAAREAGYDSVTVRNVHDNRWGERPSAGAEPRTIDFVFDTNNITPRDYTPSQAAGASTGKVRLSDADRALLAELEGPADQLPNAGNSSQPLRGGTPEARLRAQEQGFDTGRVLYHGTDTSFDGFSNEAMRRNDSGFYGRGTYFTTEPGEASYYAETRPSWQSSPDPVEGANVVPAFARGRFFEVNDGGNMAEIVPRFLETLRGMKNVPPRARELSQMWDEAVRGVDVEQVTVQMDPQSRRANWGIPDDMIDADGGATVWRDASSPVARYYPTRESAVSALALNRLSRDGHRFPLGVDAAIQKSIGADEFTDFLRANGYDGVRAGDETVVFDPRNIRSIFAAFDPAKRDSSDLLAGLSIAAPIPIAGALTQQQNTTGRPRGRPSDSQRSRGAFDRTGR